MASGAHTRCAQDCVGRAATRFPFATMNPADTDTLIVINADDPIAVHVAGAKARSLQQIMAAGLPVPAAIVIPTGFFAPWFALVLGSPSWRALQQSPQQNWPEQCAAIKAEALALPASAGQRRVLADLAARLALNAASQRFAVRSSSPEEDTVSASFAGLYDTELGVAIGGLEGAIRRCFASALDYRVLAYKAGRGIDPAHPAIALIVQQQLDSDAAGVGFSVNPLTNDFDEAAIDANWGLGESVVSGMATPDRFIVDKASGTALARHCGPKQVSLSLSAGHGTVAAPHPQRHEYCLTEAQLRELTLAICRLETRYGFPVDIEWAYAKGKLFILQARAITRYVPLPPEMLTAPGQRRRLYMDAALSKGMTSNAAMSPMGLDWLAGDMRLIIAQYMGGVRGDVTSPGGVLYLGGARMYLNLSPLLWFCSPRQLAKSNAPTDQLMADILAGVDSGRYRSAQRPAWVWPALGMLPVALWRLRRALWRFLRAVLAPESTQRRYQAEKRAFEQEYGGQFDDALPPGALQRRYGLPAFAHIIERDMPVMGAGMLGLAMVKRLARKHDDDERALADQLARGIGGNVVVDMGIRIFRLSTMLERAAFGDIGVLAERIRQRQLPAVFLAAWDSFMTEYGCRGPGEMDMANPHYADDPLLVLRQMASVANSDGGFDPAAVHRALILQRRDAVDTLRQRCGPLERVLLSRANKLAELFAGTRDTPKQHNLMYQHAVRKRLLAEGDKLVADGRLDRPEQVFDLVLSDLLAAQTDPALALRARATARTQFARTLNNHVLTFPAVIDSRGRILRPPIGKGKDGDVTGIAVSPGIVRGKIKVMHNAHDKRVDQGEILVAFTTDPGWTPLFINAAAILLEVGGVLQHGAVIAREYGKPCVAGIADILTRFTDGQLVEVDGSSGVVRFVTEAAAPSPVLRPERIAM